MDSNLHIMVRPVQQILFFLTCILLCSAGCRQDRLRVDVSGIHDSVQIERFDRDLFGISPDSINNSIGSLYKKYGDFFDIFIRDIIPPNDIEYTSQMGMR